MFDGSDVVTDTPTTAVDATAGNVLRLTPAGSETPSSDGEVSSATVEPTASAGVITAGLGETVPDVIGDGGDGATSTANTTGIKITKNV